MLRGSCDAIGLWVNILRRRRGVLLLQAGLLSALQNLQSLPDVSTVRVKFDGTGVRIDGVSHLVIAGLVLLNRLASRATFRVAFWEGNLPMFQDHTRLLEYMG